MIQPLPASRILVSWRHQHLHPPRCVVAKVEPHWQGALRDLNSNCQKAIWFKIVYCNWSREAGYLDQFNQDSDSLAGGNLWKILAVQLELFTSRRLQIRVQLDRFYFPVVSSNLEISDVFPFAPNALLCVRVCQMALLEGQWDIAQFSFYLL